MIRLNRSQTLGLDLDRHTALDAGAGTGKTTVMSLRYVQHLLSSIQRATRVLPASPRTPLQGMGAIRCPARERTSLKDWQGLLPSETVAITFTRKAAAELKGKIRGLISNLRAQPPVSGDEDGIHDPRLSDQGDVEMLLSLIDDAPISTIDAFLSSITGPWIGLVSEDPAGEQMEEEGSILLREEAIRTAWRLQRGMDGIEAGMSGDIEAFLEARDRLAVRLGGQRSSSVVVRGMLKRSLFVEEAQRRLRRRAEGREVTVEILEELFTEPVEGILDEFFPVFHQAVRAWVDTWLDGGASFVTLGDVPEGVTRYRWIEHLCSLPMPDSEIMQLQWVWHVTHAMCTPTNAIKQDCKALTRARPPASKGWPSGVATKGANTTLSNDVKNLICANAEAAAEEIRALLVSSEGLLVRRLGRASNLLCPALPDPTPVPDSIAHPPRIGIEIPQLPNPAGTRLESELELEVMRDLFTVHNGVREILSRLKTQDGVRDHDDIHRLAEDLLLARCPSVCRRWYPTSVIDALDSMNSDPWLDDHLHRAIIAAQGEEEVLQDLGRRIEILRDMRRRFRAFIIDEYQDTNPQHFRLLARLWGRRKLEESELAAPAGEWDPTICIVGDMKQSIYRFRQAEVTVMRTAVESIRRMNVEEGMMEHRCADLRRPDAARDPRPIPGSGGTGSTFTTATLLASEDSQREEWISFSLDDDGSTLSPEAIARRSEGHIEMRTNYRTLPRLMRTMNGIFSDTFDSRHHLLPGPWHANSQDLEPGREGTRTAALEWILPTRVGSEPRPMDPEVAIDPFLHVGSSDRDLGADMLAKRLSALLEGGTARVWSAEDSHWRNVDEEAGLVRPEDIMILVSSRARIPALIQALDAHGVPAMADRQGTLLTRPAIQPLMALLDLFCNPNDKNAALDVARSSIVGMDDGQISLMLREGDGNWLSEMAQRVESVRLTNLLNRMESQVVNGDIVSALTTAIDHSDLLYAYPRESDRQDIENWMALRLRIAGQVGDDSASILSRLKRLKALGAEGPSSACETVGGAVKIMTIHSAKGLESPVVVLFDLFATGSRDAQFSSRDNVLVTTDIIAGRIQPWPNSVKPNSGLWELAHLMDDGQQRAERRRQFYVALTRAESRLILVGTPSRGATSASDGSISVQRGEGRQNMGQMFLDGLAAMSLEAGTEDSCWSQGGLDQSGAVLSLDPGALLLDAGIGEEGVGGITIFHHPDCFSTQIRTSPLNRWRQRLELTELATSATPQTAQRTLNHSISLTSHSLDTANSCRRRHWLSTRLNWNSERFDLVRESRGTDYWPSATEFGSLFHRLLEIGLPNPGSDSSVGLDTTWCETQPDLLMDDNTMGEVLAQSSIIDEEALERVKLRLLHLAKLTRNGALGRLTRGEEFDGMTVEGLRTELPFHIIHSTNAGPISRGIWSPDGILERAIVETVETIFDGRADLVLALRDNEGKGWLQVVDAKTSGCLNGFNPVSPLEGTELQLVGEESSPHPTTPAEEEILYKHRLQLALYCLALEMGESTKPSDQRREILPPAILVGASGRMIRLTDTEFDAAKTQLLELLDWMGRTSAEGEGATPPSRLPMAESEPCRSCPFNAGHIKLCGPEGAPLGPASQESQEIHP